MKKLLGILGAVGISSMSTFVYANPFQTTEYVATPFQEYVDYYNPVVIKVNNEQDFTCMYLDTTTCRKKVHKDHIEYTGKIYCYGDKEKVTIKMYDNGADMYGYIKFDDEKFTSLRVDNQLYVNLYYFLVDFAKEK